MKRKVLIAGMTILVLLVVLLAPGVVTHWGDWDRSRAREEGARYTLARLAEEVERFHKEAGRYPETLDELTAPRPSGSPVNRIPTDPWGHAYVYRLGKDGTELISYGADGVPGGEGEAADISIKAR